jgi:GDP-L-fucose synthase
MTIMSNPLQPHEKIYVAGHRGLVGSALMRRLQKEGCDNIVTHTHKELDLTSQAAVNGFFASEQPDYVFLAAAKVGGIYANNTYPADFIYDNLMIQSNIIHAAYETGVKKLLFLGSSCIYPKFAPQPIKEDYLLDGKLESTNEPYAIAKIAGIKMCAAYNRQYGTNFMSVMPTNLYGIGDNYDLNSSHVLPALIRKVHEAKQLGKSEVTIWGSGTPRREFLFSEDLADACIFLVKRYSAGEIGEIINIGTGEDITIKDLALFVADVIGYQGDFVLDTSKPDGTPRKLLDVSRLHKLGWQAQTNLRLGIKAAYEDFLHHYVE